MKNTFYLTFYFFFAVVGITKAKYSGRCNLAGLAIIKEFEGWRPNFYYDPVGIRTIGYGHTCPASGCSNPIYGKYPIPLTMESGHNLLVDDVARFEDCVRNKITYHAFNENQFSALVSFAFNLGCGQFSEAHLVGMLNREDVAGASAEIPLWNKGGGRVLDGLTRRRAAEQALFNKPVGPQDPCDGTVNADVLNIRSSPSASASKVGSMTNGAVVSVRTKVQGDSVEGNSDWYQLPNGYVAARFVSTIGECPGSSSSNSNSDSTCRGTVDADALNVRSSPSTAGNKVWSFPNGASLTIESRADGDTVGGNGHWFKVSQGYVSALYVKITSTGGHDWCTS